MVQGHVALGGFTWGTIGVSQVDNLATVRLGTVAGVWGVTFAVVTVNAALAQLVDGGGDRRGRAVIAAVAAALALAPLALPFAAADGQDIDVAAIQIDVREARDGTTTDEDRRVAEMNIAQHERLAGEPPPDLVVWGEGASTRRRPRPGAAVDGLAGRRRGGCAHGHRHRGRRPRRQPAHVRPAARRGGCGDRPIRQDAARAVRGVRAVPFAAGWIEAIDQVPVDRVPGEDPPLRGSRPDALQHRSVTRTPSRPSPGGSWMPGQASSSCQ